MMVKARNLSLFETGGKLLLFLETCNYRIGLVPWWQMSGWELCAMKHLSWVSLSRVAAPGGSSE